MRDVYVYTLFERDGGRPRCTGIKLGEMVKIIDLYRPGARKAISVIDRRRETIRNIIVRSSNDGDRVITSDFKGHITAFDLPIELRQYNVFDMHLDQRLKSIRLSDSPEGDANIVRSVLAKMPTFKVKDYQRLIANAAVVYHDLQTRGLNYNFTKVYPIWSQKSWAGRANTSGFNVQGFYEPHIISPCGYDNPVLIHFDWIGADIRAAGLLSGDEQLNTSFVSSDPYTHMMDIINRDSTHKITRDECKRLLLESINSMDFSSIALTEIFTALGDWIARCGKATSVPNGYLETILGRRFRVSEARDNNPLAVLNGAMQGTVAHGMQNVLRKVWEKIGNRIITEIHDSLIVASSPDISDIKATIDLVAKIMLYPFSGLLPSNPVFPLRVSVGKKWKKWKLNAIYRHSGVEYVKAAKEGSPVETIEETGTA